MPPAGASPQDCRRRADECVRLAQSAPASQRFILLGMAQTWLQLADQAIAENELIKGDKDTTGDRS